MLFSERYGYKKVDKALVWEEIPDKMRKRLWKRISESIFEPIKEKLICEDYYKNMPYGLGRLIPEPACLWEFLDSLYDKFFPPDFNELYTTGYTGFDIYTTENKCINVKAKKQEIEGWFKSAEWNKVFDFIDFLNKYYPGKEKLEELNVELNKVLKEENSAYRIIDRLVTTLTSEVEIEEVERALNPPDKFKAVQVYLKKALEKFSERKKPDYQNAIKECMSALDSLVSIISGKKTIFSKFAKSLKIHPALKDGFIKLYSWSSDAEGIRHGITNEELKPLYAEARYMLVTISAFINYVIAKYEESEIRENERSQ